MLRIYISEFRIVVFVFANKQVCSYFYHLYTFDRKKFIYEHICMYTKLYAYKFSSPVGVDSKAQ